jgi:amino acid transporter
MAEKDNNLVADATDYGRRPSYIDPATGIENKQGRITEAAGLYGDIETAEEYGYVTRG